MLAIQCGEGGELDSLSLAGRRVEGLSVHRFAPEGAHATEGRVCNRGQATGPPGQRGGLIRPNVYNGGGSLGVLLHRATWHTHHQLSICAEPYPVMPVSCRLMGMGGKLLVSELNNVWNTVYQEHQDSEAKDAQECVHANLQVCERPVCQHFFTTNFYLCCLLHLGGEVVVVYQVPRGFHSASKANTAHILHDFVVWAISFAAITRDAHHADVYHRGRTAGVSWIAGLTHSSQAATGYEGSFYRFDGGSDLLHGALLSFWGWAAWWRLLPLFLLTVHLFPIISIVTAVVLSANSATLEAAGIAVGWLSAVPLKFDLQAAVANSYSAFAFGLLASLTDGHF